MFGFLRRRRRKKEAAHAAKLDKIHKEMAERGELERFRKTVADNGRARYDSSFYGDDVDPKDVRNFFR